MHTNFEIERVSLIGGDPEISSSQKFSKKALIGTLAAISAAIVFVAVFSGSSNNSSWITDKTPNVLIALPALNQMTDVKLKNSSEIAQVNQIKYRADSISSLPEDSKYFSNIAPVIQKLISLQNSESLSEDDQKIASKLIEMVENYQKSRMVATAFDLNIATQSQKESMLNQVRSWLRNEYKSFNKDLGYENSELNKQIELFDDIKESLVDLVDQIPTKLCSELAWYERWWNTVKGWFGSKSECLESGDNLLDLSGELPATLCSELEWYKRWWNTIKGWFGSKPTNCTEGILLDDAQAAATKLCSELEWYKRWWNTIKGWFGSKPTNCTEGILLDDAQEAAAVLCKDLPWYNRWWNTIKGWFGSKADCAEELAAPISLLRYGQYNPSATSQSLNLLGIRQFASKPPGWPYPQCKKGYWNPRLRRCMFRGHLEQGKLIKYNTLLASNSNLQLFDINSLFGSVAKLFGKKGGNGDNTELFDMKSLFGAVGKVVNQKGGSGDMSKNRALETSRNTLFNPMTYLANIASEVGKTQNLGSERNLDISLPACDSVEFMQKWNIELTDTTCLDRDTGLYYDLNLQGSSLVKDAAKDAAKDAVNDAKSDVTDAVNDAKSDVTDAVNDAKSDVTDAAKDAANTATDAAKDAANTATDDVKDAENTAKNAATSAEKDAAQSAEKVKTTLCKDLAWYSRWWNTIKGWFGYQPTNCTQDIVEQVITSINENDAVLQTVLASRATKSIKVIVPNTVHFESSNLKQQQLASMPNFALLFNIGDAYIKPQTTESITLAGLEPYARSAKSQTWFNKFAEVFRNKGLPMELYTVPVADDLLDKIPSFVDTKPVNSAIKFLDEFEKARSVILAHDKLDREFLDHIERYLMAWAVSEDKQKFADAFQANMKNWSDLAFNLEI